MTWTLGTASLADAPVVPVVHPTQVGANQTSGVAWLNQNWFSTADTWVLFSDDPSIYPNTATFSGSVSEGQVAALNFAWGSNSVNLQYTAGASQTPISIAQGLRELIVASATLASAGIYAWPTVSGTITISLPNALANADGATPLTLSMGAGDTASGLARSYAYGANVLDLGPQLVLGKAARGNGAPRIGDTTGSLIFAGPDTNAPTGYGVSYGYIFSSIENPAFGSWQGNLYFNTADPLNSGGFPRLRITRGLSLAGSGGTYPTDPGQGAVDAPGGYFVGGTPLADALSAARPAFIATKSGTDQTGIADATYTKVTFGAVERNGGAFYDSANSKWTPPAGDYVLGVTMQGTGAAAGNLIVTVFYKNGSPYRRHLQTVGVTGSWGVSFHAPVTADGDDYFEVYVYIDGGAGSRQVDGDTARTIFYGRPFV